MTGERLGCKPSINENLKPFHPFGSADLLGNRELFASEDAVAVNAVVTKIECSRFSTWTVSASITPWLGTSIVDIPNLRTAPGLCFW